MSYTSSNNYTGVMSRRIALVLCSVLFIISAFNSKITSRSQTVPSKDRVIMSTSSKDNPRGNGLRPVSYLAGLASGVAAAAFFLSNNSPVFETATDIPSKYISENREISGKIVKITDGDTMRLRHTPSRLFGSAADFKGPLSEHTIVIRIAGVDTPETAKFGNAGQAFANEAKEFATQKLLRKNVKVKLLSRDQYGRIVGAIKYSERNMIGLQSTKDISEELLSEGLAVVYRQGGAKYDGGVQKYNRLEEAAINARKGVWRNGRSKADLPSDYKQKTKAKSKSKPKV